MKQGRRAFFNSLGFKGLAAGTAVVGTAVVSKAIEPPEHRVRLEVPEGAIAQHVELKPGTKNILVVDPEKLRPETFMHDLGDETWPDTVIVFQR